MATGQFCLKWNNFHNSIVTAFESLQSTEELVDVTLMCEGRNVKAHKVILSACSPYFRNLFKETPCKHPIIILKDVLYCDLVAILQFMYQGEVLVDQDGLASFLKTAELLQVSGLAGSTTSSAKDAAPEETNNVPPPLTSKTSIPLITKPERTKSPSSPKAAIVKVRNDIVPVEPVIEKENILLTREPEVEPMQSCSYQTPENVIIKTESAEEQDYPDMDFLEPIDDPGSTTTEEQSILERSLKAQVSGKPLQNKIIGNHQQFVESQKIVDAIPVDTKSRTEFIALSRPAKRRNITKPKRFDNSFLYNTQIVINTNRSKRPRPPSLQIPTKLPPSRMPTNCPRCNKYLSQARYLKLHLFNCKTKSTKRHSR